MSGTKKSVEDSENPVSSDQLLSGKGHGSKMAVNAEDFIVALMTEKSVSAAAQKVGISEATAYRYMRDRQFRALLQRRRNQAFTQSIARMDGLVSDALETLAGVMNSSQEDSKDRISASVNVVRLMLQARGTYELSDRIAVLEAEREDEE